MVLSVFLIFFLSRIIGNRFSKIIESVQLYFDRKISGHDLEKIPRKQLIIKELEELYRKVDMAIERKNQLEEEQKKYSVLLKQMVKERTSELETQKLKLNQRNKDLERANELFVDREFRIKELKDRILFLEQKIVELKNRMN